MKSSRMCFFVIACLTLWSAAASAAEPASNSAIEQSVASAVVSKPAPPVAEPVAPAAAAPSSAAAASPPRGSLVIIGGALRFGERELWARMVELAGGPGAKIAVFPTASINPARSAARASEALKAAGGDPFMVPVALEKIDVDYRSAVEDPALVEQVRSAGGIFFTGGEQSRITKALVAADGKNTPMLEAVWDVYRRGGVVIGTSAGAAVMSHVMYRDARNVLDTLQKGVNMGQEIGYGLGFLDSTWFVEQHSLTRGRFARALAAMQSQNLKFGIGVAENTALVVTDNTHVKVIGDYGAVVMDLSEATVDPAIKGFNLKNARLTYLDRGDSFDMATLVVTPSAEKQTDPKLDPNAEDFHPEYDDRLFTNDILGNNAVCDILRKLIINKTGEAIGLAFDGGAAATATTPGFEFRFYRGKDTVGWHTEAFGGEDFTIANMHLDIRPISVGPLFVQH
jgi:cyanophycinase